MHARSRRPIGARTCSSAGVGSWSSGPNSCGRGFPCDQVRLEEELRWRQASADGRIELCVRRWVHPVVARWGAGSIGRGFGKKLLEGCRARSRRWQPACLPLLGRAGFANVAACHLSVFVLCRGATYRSSSEKRLRFFKPAVVAYVRCPLPNNPPLTRMLGIQSWLFWGLRMKFSHPDRTRPSRRRQTRLGHHRHPPCRKHSHLGCLSYHSGAAGQGHHPRSWDK